jgi:hypothetical protein
MFKDLISMRLSLAILATTVAILSASPSFAQDYKSTITGNDYSVVQTDSGYNAILMRGVDAKVLTEAEIDQDKANFYNKFAKVEQSYTATVCNYEQTVCYKQKSDEKGILAHDYQALSSVKVKVNGQTVSTVAAGPSQLVIEKATGRLTFTDAD